MKTEIRPMVNKDLGEVKNIYNHYIEHTHINFETIPYDDAYMKNWYKQFSISERHQAFVAINLENNKILGFALSQKFRNKSSYDTSVETTIYLAPDAGGQGLGKKLGQVLHEKLKPLDIHRAYAIIALPNDASIGFHQSMGYKKAAHFTQTGRKFGKFYDIVYMEYQFK
ncbi:MAG: GNAT family N-acetyltransferase [Hyphomicrobiales bacterium]